jgi:stage IV sporulation protein FB
LQAFAILAGYYGVILLHECGHMIAAQRRGSVVSSIELYPIWGLTHFTEPHSRFDYCVIAWGGVLAQAIVGVPIVVYLEIFGTTRFQSLNTIMAIFGYFNLVIAIFNLIPLRPLDGAIAWRLLPSLFRRSPSRSRKRDFGRGSWQ